MNDQRIKQLLLQDAAFYDAQMNELKLSLFAEQLRSLSIEQIQKAQVHFRNEKGRKTMPMPADIIAFNNPNSDPDNEAREAASRIVAAVTKFGWANAEQAQDFIGELGWHVVERTGGWNYLCQNLGTNLNVSVFQAQARDLAKSTIARGESGLSRAPQLPKAEEKINNLISGNDLNKQIGERKWTK